MTQQSYLGAQPRKRTLQEIADEIADDWFEAGARAAEIIDGLSLCETLTDRVYDQSAGDLVAELLPLLAPWHGEAAERVKRELARKIGKVLVEA